MSGGYQESSGQSTPQATPEQMLQIYSKYLPSILSTTAGQAGSTAQDIAKATTGANPIYTASGLEQLQNYAPGYQKAGADLATSQAQSTADLIKGAGGQAATNAADLVSRLNPVQNAANTQATNLLNSINLNGLSGGEQAAVERSLNQSNYATGNLGIDNATNAVANAMTFGNALQAKRDALGNAINTANNTASNQNTFTNPVGVATVAGNTSNNFGLGTFAPTQGAATATTPFSFASSLGNQIAGVASANKSSNSSSGVQGGLCYLTTACCEYKGLPDDCEELTVLRQFRDSYVPAPLVEEYYKTAPSIVDKIRGDRELMEYIHGVVRQCVKEIKDGENEKALNGYKRMFEKLSKEVGI